MKERLQKIIAASGLMARRKAEEAFQAVPFANAAEASIEEAADAAETAVDSAEKAVDSAEETKE